MSRLTIIEDPSGDVDIELLSNGGVAYETEWFRVDGDGDPTNHYNDPCWQADTSLHFEGKAVNALTVPYVVANPIVARKVPGVVLGCKARVEFKGRVVDCVVADIGPRKKIGEGSVRLAELLGMPKSPPNGGQEGSKVRWTWYPGVPAVVDGKTYKLQPL